jgi:hypothetical protein
MKMLTTITLRSSQKRLRVGSIRSPAALPRMAVRGRAFLSECSHDNTTRYYKGGQSEACPPNLQLDDEGGHGAKTRLCPPYKISSKHDLVRSMPPLLGVLAARNPIAWTRASGLPVDRTR